MATMNVSLPDLMSDWVEAQIKTGKYSSNGDYVRDLIRNDQEAHEKMQALQDAITQGLDSGVSDFSMEYIRNLARNKVSAVQ